MDALAGLVGAVGTAALVGHVAHGILKPLLEARGVAPWTRRDSLGALPSVLLGSAAIGWALVDLATLLARHSTPVAGAVDAIALLRPLGLLLPGAVVIRLGVLALRKLSR